MSVLSPRKRPLADVSPGRPEIDDRSDLCPTLARILRQLERLSLRRSAAAPDEQGSSDEYTYLELEIPGDDWPEMDLNVHDGKVFVRIASR